MYLLPLRGAVVEWLEYRLLESLLFTERGVGVYKRLECSQSIFVKPKHSVCSITSVPCLAIVCTFIPS